MSFPKLISVSIQKIIFLCVFVCVFIFLMLPSFARAESIQNNDDLLTSIQNIFNKSLNSVSIEIQNLRNEVNALREELRQVQNNTQTNTIPFVSLPPTTAILGYDIPNNILKSGDKGEEIKRLQEFLIRFGFNIPAGITGNFLAQTQNALKDLQQKHNIPITGIYDEATQKLLKELIDFQYKYTPPPDIHPPAIEEKPKDTVIVPFIDKKETQEQPIVKAELHIITPNENALFNAGQQIQIKWNTDNAPENAWIVFKLVNKLTKTEKTILKTLKLSSVYDFTLPSNMPGDNHLIAELFFEKDGSKIFLVNKNVTFAILGGFVETKTENSYINNVATSSQNTSFRSTSFYLQSAFTTCMAEYPDAITLIHGWIDSGLTRDQFPWGQITGPSANKTAECEGNNFYNYNTYPSSGYGSNGSATYKCFYPNATINGTAPGYTVWCEENFYNCRQGSESGSTISLDGLILGTPSSCEGGYSSDSSNNTYGSECRSQSTQLTCSAISGCSWYTGYDSNYCDSSGSTAPYSSGSSSMQNCWYDNASRNSEPFINTRIWCESDYYNCHFDSPTGTVVTMDGLSLGAPTSCESGWNSDYNNESPASANPNPFLANVKTAISSISQNLQKIFGF